jgi:hypothetical protein
MLLSATLTVVAVWLAFVWFVDLDRFRRAKMETDKARARQPRLLALQQRRGVNLSPRGIRLSHEDTRVA